MQARDDQENRMDEHKATPERLTIVLHSGDMDKVYSALIIANGALAMGMEATIFFTFWGLQRLKKGVLEKGPLSKMNFLLQDFKELGGKIMACDMTMEIMGIRPEDLRQDLIDEYCAVGSFVQEARNSQVTLFI
jgi:peroxiredoxin family protein